LETHCAVWNAGSLIAGTKDIPAELSTLFVELCF